MKRILLAALLAALAMNLWGFVYWVVLPTGPIALEAAAEEPALAEALLTYLPATGSYFVPALTADAEEIRERQATGPIATIHFRRDGVRTGDPRVFLLGFAHLFLLALIATALLRAVGSALPHYGGRVFFVWSVGAIGSLFVTLSQPIWWHHPWRYHLVVSVYALGAWLAAGLVLGALIRRGRLRF